MAAEENNKYIYFPKESIKCGFFSYFLYFHLATIQQNNEDKLWIVLAICQKKHIHT